MKTNTKTVTNTRVPVKPVTAKDRIMKLMKNRVKGLTAREIAEKANVNYNTCRKVLGELLHYYLYTEYDKKLKVLRYSTVPF